MKKITVVGSGYVGMSLAVLLSKKNKVLVYDIDSDRVKKINKRESTISDNYLSSYLQSEPLSLSATIDKDAAYKNKDFVIICTPTDFNEENNSFDTSSVDMVIEDIIERNSSTYIVIKSTIPIGYTESIKKKYQFNNITFSPEFLREGSALEDNLYPSRIIIGDTSSKAIEFSNILHASSLKKEIPKFYMGNNEAEATKLFSNTYLAMRVAFFNELDSFCIKNDLNASNIINGVCADKRISNNYNNPSFGYGGYCLPKDTKQLLSNFHDTPNSIIKSVVESNKLRKEFLIDHISSKKFKIIGFYGVMMKKNSTNFRSSAVLDLISGISASKTEVIIYDDEIFDEEFMGNKVYKNIEDFKKSSELIIANRNSDKLFDVKDKVFTRDIFNIN